MGKAREKPVTTETVAYDKSAMNMRLFEAIIDANHRAVAGDKEAGLHPADFETNCRSSR